jgi:hypothetical protein
MVPKTIVEQPILSMPDQVPAPVAEPAPIVEEPAPVVESAQVNVAPPMLAEVATVAEVAIPYSETCIS